MYEIESQNLSELCAQLREFLDIYVGIDFDCLNHEEQEFLETLQSAWEEGRNILADYEKENENADA